MDWTQRDRISAATHGCPHHVDELVALGLLKRAVPGVVEVTFLTRDEVSSQARMFDVLIDTGGEYDPEGGRFDHHQGGEEVEGRSSAGLLFDALYQGDERYEYLKPVIDYVDAIDCGTVRWNGAVCGEPSFGRGRGMLSISALLKAVGGFQHDVARSHRCLELIEALVQSWLRQAQGYVRARSALAAAQRVGRGIFLHSDEPYGPALLEFLQQESDVAFLGFPDRPGRFVVVAVRGPRGDNRMTFEQDLPGATFVHLKGFMAIFQDRRTAQRALSGR